MQKPILRFPEFSDNWEMKLLEDMAIRGSGHTPSKAFDNYYDGNIPWVSLADSKYLDQGFIEKTTITISKDGIKNSSAVLHKSGCVLLSRDAGIGKSAVMKVDMAVSQHFIVWKPLEDKLSNWFLYYKLQIHKPEFERIAIGSTIKTIGLPYFKSLTFNFPQLPEQTKIANFLTAIDEKIQALKEKKRLLEEYKKGLMQKIFSQEIRFKQEDGSYFPDWEEKSLREILTEHKTRNLKNQVEEVFSVAKNKGVINQIEHLGRSYASEITTNYKVVYPDDIIYTKSPTSDFPFGIIKQNKLNRTGIVSVLYGVFTPRNKNLGLLLDYYFSIWQNTYNYLNPLVQKGAKNTMNIGNNDFLNGEELYLPSSTIEQQKIAKFLTSIDEKIEKVGQQIEEAQTFKKGLLQQMFV
ncbi:restriction endonuclease subunit S [Lacihabitans soyangensis]|nr:restriction endonuclease subunit S [Lacihabitans soyangensis]